MTPTVGRGTRAERSCRLLAEGEPALDPGRVQRGERTRFLNLDDAGELEDWIGPGLVGSDEPG